MKKICDHPSLCVAVAEDGNKAVSAETEVDETPQGETPRTDKHESEVMDDTEHTESKREAVLSAIASAGLSKRDLEGDAAASGKHDDACVVVRCEVMRRVTPTPPDRQKRKS